MSSAIAIRSPTRAPTNVARQVLRRLTGDSVELAPSAAVSIAAEYRIGASLPPP
ncbi:hypothetical protein [Variovorax paradoxus]|uniref:hypothetical protein n=1 Tax=Variovorax paradoxus TaxID=34073 RepID=UPI0027D7D67F|nr:hypothetical protein [Variovorax paradoxus]